VFCSLASCDPCSSIYPIIIITRAYSSWSSLINKQIWAALGDASTVANQAISNIRTVRSFGTERKEIAKYTAATGDALDKSIKDAYANGGTYALTNYLDLATSVLLLWYGGSVAMGEFSGSLTVGKLITFQVRLFCRCIGFVIRCALCVVIGSFGVCVFSHLSCVHFRAFSCTGAK
jgi:ABC-type multidrug transport system fused ATPase/permease subunit